MKNLTIDDLTQWLGDDATKTDILDMLLDIARGVYRVEQLQQDIRDYQAQGGEPCEAK